jgi:hypothetical protein
MEGRDVTMTDTNDATHGANADDAQASLPVLGSFRRTHADTPRVTRSDEPERAELKRAIGLMSSLATPASKPGVAIW